MSAAPPSILIVEDERLVAKDLQQSLIEFGYDTCGIASSGEEAMARVSEKCPDVVLMDIRIAGPLDGIQTASLLQQRCSTIIIYLTAHADKPMIDRAKRTAPQGYLVKPVKEAELRSTIEIALHNRQLDLEKGKRHAAEQRLSVISDNIPIAVAYFDAKGRVQFANRVFREMVPFKENPHGVAASTFLGDLLYRQSYPARQRALVGETSCLMIDIEKDGAIRHQEVTYLPDHDSAGDVCGVYAISHDVTERNQLTGDLQLAHLDLETLLNAVPASITSWNQDLSFRFANQAAKLQLAAESTAGGHMREVLGAARFELMASYVAGALAGQDCVVELTETVGRSTRHVRHYFIPERRGSAVTGMYVLAFDITDLRESNDAIRRLVLRLDTVREEEQRSVATILHDGIAQNLFVARLAVDALAANPPSEIPRLCKDLSTALTHCLEDIRQLAHSLRPAALAALGVAAAIGEHARYFSAQSHLAINVECADSLPALSDAAQLLLFRAAQEALTNVARHANAKTVDIKLWSDDHRVWLAVTDDGAGVAANAMHNSKSLGLLMLKERFSAGGGSVSLLPAHPTGTVAQFSLPMEQGLTLH